MSVRECVVLLLCLFLTRGALSEEPATARPKANFPHSDIFLMTLHLNADIASGESVLGDVRNITSRQGYDNQPFFAPDGASILFTRGDDYQTDIYEYDLTSRKITRLSDTDSMEFSPTPDPENDRIAFVSDRNGSIWSASRDAMSAQSWLFASSNNPETIGYFAWNHNTDQMLYWSRFGFSVVLADHRSGTTRFVMGNTPPSTPQIVPGTNTFSFMHRQSNQQVWIKELDPETLAVRPLILMTGDNNNHVWTPAGDVLTIQNDMLYRALQREPTWRWAPLADLRPLGLRDANRLAISPDGSYLAVVAVGLDDIE